MNIKKIENLSTTIKSLDTSKFYSVNGHGIISFGSDVKFMINRNSTCFMNSKIGSEESINLCKELNEAIKPILQKYKQIAEQQIKDEVK